MKRDGVRLVEAGRAGGKEGGQVVASERCGAVGDGGRDELGLALEGTGRPRPGQDGYCTVGGRSKSARDCPHLMYFFQPATTASIVMSA